MLFRSADIVILAERETQPSRAMGEALLARTPHEPLDVPQPPLPSRVEAFRLHAPGDRAVAFAWYTRGLPAANLRRADDLDACFYAGAYVMLYRHRSRQDARRLTVHPVGNAATPPGPHYGPARRMALASPALLRDGLVHLDAAARERGLDCPVTYEISHHDPTELAAPVMFLEIGDGPAAYADPVLIDAAVDAALRVAFRPLPPPATTCLGISYQSHYAESFGRATLQRDWAFGHIVSSWLLPDLTADDFATLVGRTVGGVDRIVYKRLRGFPEAQRARLESWCAARGIRFEKWSPAPP